MLVFGQVTKHDYADCSRRRDAVRAHDVVCDLSLSGIGWAVTASREGCILMYLVYFGWGISHLKGAVRDGGDLGRFSAHGLRQVRTAGDRVSWVQCWL